MAQTNSKEPVRLRRRTVKNGRQSLYLDIYIGGKRSYEYLKLYLEPERTSEDRRKNQQTLMLAEAVRARRILDLQNDRFGFEGRYRVDTPFFAFFEQMIEERSAEAADSVGNAGNWRSCLLHIRSYAGREDITFRDVTPEWCEGLRRYLEKEASSRSHAGSVPLAQSSRQSYWTKFKACLHAAVDKRIIPDDPSRGIKGFKVEQAERPYLTIEEVRSMAATPSRHPGLRRAFLFSCLTGLRKSDILKLRWRDVQRQGDFTRIIFRQKKTKGLEYLDLSPEAVQFMGERGGSDELVFKDFSYSRASNDELRLWAAHAGVRKHISFHCGRHTFAVMMLDLGADIYTVSKLLGHRELRTTQVYAALLDKKKQAAVSMIPSLGLEG